MPCACLRQGRPPGLVVIKSSGVRSEDLEPEHLVSVAVLLKNHGVFTIGKNAQAVVKAAVMVEDVARAVWLALQIGQSEEISPEQVAKLHERYTIVDGQ